jgi:hypothetical protein
LKGLTIVGRARGPRPADRRWGVTDSGRYTRHSPGQRRNPNNPCQAPKRRVRVIWSSGYELHLPNSVKSSSQFARPGACAFEPMATARQLQRIEAEAPALGRVPFGCCSTSVMPRRIVSTSQPNSAAMYATGFARIQWFPKLLVACLEPISTGSWPHAS